MQNGKMKAMSEGFILGAIFFVLLVITMYIPSIEFLTIFLLPIPFAIYSYHHGYKASVFLSIIIMFTISIFTFYFFIIFLPIVLMALLAGTFIGESLRKGRHPYETWIRSTMGFALGFFAFILIVGLVTDSNLATEYQIMVRESLDSAEVFLSQAGVDLSASDMEMIESQMMVLLDLVPALLITVSIVLGFVTQWLTHKVINKWDGTKFAFPVFRSFQLPRVMLWIYFTTMILSWFSFSEGSMVGTVILNASIILGMLFSIQGLSFIIYILHKRNRPRFISVLIIIFSIVFFPLGMYLTRILGIIDIGFMVRKRIK